MTSDDIWWKAAIYYVILLAVLLRKKKMNEILMRMNPEQQPEITSHILCVCGNTSNEYKATQKAKV